MKNSPDNDSIHNIHSVAISAACDKVIYPLGATVHVRVRISDTIVGKKIIIKVINKDNNNLLLTRKIDPTLPKFNPNVPFYETSFRMRGKQWKIGSRYTIITSYGNAEVSDSFMIDKRQPIIQTDRSVYMAGSDMIITVVDPDANLDSQKVEMLGGRSNQKVIISTSMDTISNYKLKETGKDTGIFQGIITILPEDARKPRKVKGPLDGSIRARRGDQIILTYSSDSGKAIVLAYSSNFGATVELDQKVYTWTDRVYVTVVAPDHNSNPRAIDEIKVKIKTKKNVLHSYVLRETGIDTGIFTGYFVLTGNPNIKGIDGIDGNGLNPSGLGPIGIGPIGGFLPCEDQDVVTVSFEFTKGQTVTGAALIRWNVGEIKWLEPKYNLDSEAILQIVDPDMNLNSDGIDEFNVRIKSDTDPIGIDLRMKETGPATGIFHGKVVFSDKSNSKDNLLRVSYGDIITAEYIDRTLPSPYSRSSSLRLTATTEIGRTILPLERVQLSNPVILDENGKPVTQIHKNKLTRITAAIKNNQTIEQTFAFVVQIQNEKGNTIALLITEGQLKPTESVHPSVLWMPELVGKHIIQIFVWRTKDVPSALSAPTTLNIEVL